MPDLTLPAGPEWPDEENTGPDATPHVLRCLASTLGQLLVEHWPAAQQDRDVRWMLVVLAELANALLSGDNERAAQLLAELDRQADR